VISSQIKVDNATAIYCPDDSQKTGRKPGEYSHHLHSILIVSPKSLQSSFIYGVWRNYGELSGMLWRCDEADGGLPGVFSQWSTGVWL